MNKNTILKLIAPVIAIGALIANDLGYVITADSEGTIVAAVAILITAFTKSIKES